MMPSSLSVNGFTIGDVVPAGLNALDLVGFLIVHPASWQNEKNALSRSNFLLRVAGLSFHPARKFTRTSNVKSVIGRSSPSFASWEKRSRYFLMVSGARLWAWRSSVKIWTAVARVVMVFFSF